MSKGRPIGTKCPSCKRGKYGYDSPKNGVRRTPDPPKTVKNYNGRRVGYIISTMTRVECLDCGHKWWSTLSSGSSL